MTHPLDYFQQMSRAEPACANQVTHFVGFRGPTIGQATDFLEAML